MFTVKLCRVLIAAERCPFTFDESERAREREREGWGGGARACGHFIFHTTDAPSHTHGDLFVVFFAARCGDVRF